MQPKRLLITGGSGFIGSAFIRRHLSKCDRIINLDLLTYAADLPRLDAIRYEANYSFVHGDINDQALVKSLIQDEKIDTIVHFAAESHVDRSIEAPAPFLITNVMGTYALLEVARSFPGLHFHHVSTDEVYGSLGPTGFFTEESPYRPNSPYSASKAASDHFVRAYAQTYGISTTLSHCSNNYGPFQHPEKLIPRVIHHCLSGLPIPIYGSGAQVRDWIYVDDHVDALWLILSERKKGEVYGIGGKAEKSNCDLVDLVLKELLSLTGEDFRHLITFVEDRPGHDFRYAIDTTKIECLGWKPTHSLVQGLSKTLAAAIIPQNTYN